MNRRRANVVEGIVVEQTKRENKKPHRRVRLLLKGVGY
jgi:hypothetical protein